jgi:hypothetical protein
LASYEVEEHFPARLKRQIAEKKVKLVTIDATKLALDLGLGMRINTLMQSCFYQLSGVLPVDQALVLLKQSIKELYTKKGTFIGSGLFLGLLLLLSPHNSSRRTRGRGCQRTRGGCSSHGDAYHHVPGILGEN